MFVLIQGNIAGPSRTFHFLVLLMSQTCSLLASALVMYSKLTKFISHVMLWTALAEGGRVIWDEERVPFVSDFCVYCTEPTQDMFETRTYSKHAHCDCCIGALSQQLQWTTGSVHLYLPPTAQQTTDGKTLPTIAKGKWEQHTPLFPLKQQKHKPSLDATVCHDVFKVLELTTVPFSKMNLALLYPYLPFKANSPPP